MFSRAKRARAFSLIEMMAAIGVVGIGVVGLTQALSQTNETHRRLEQRQIANDLLRMKLAECAPIAEAAAPRTGKFDPPFDAYEWQIEVTPTEIAGLFRAKVQISWTGRRDRRSLRAETLVPQRLPE
jgi:prepilin-type N-terminal cleavage/methylation domain-containing protein